MTTFNVPSFSGTTEDLIKLLQTRFAGCTIECSFTATEITNSSTNQKALQVKTLMELVSTKGKISAIKAYRAETGADLKTSKDAIERMIQETGTVPFEF